MDLIIVESPSKAKTISKYLKGKYKVDASAGHIRDLPVHSLGVDVKNNFEPKYVNSEGKEDIIRRLTDETKKAGQRLLDLFDAAGRVTTMDYASETATLTDLVGKMRETMYAEALTAIGIESAPDDIEEANDAFNAIYLQRSAAERDRAFAADMKTLRPATDEAFDALAYAINALFAVNEMVTNDEGKRTALTKVIDDVNAIVVRFRKTIGQKSPSGSSSTDEPADEPGGETPEPGGGEETDSPSVI